MKMKYILSTAMIIGVVALMAGCSQVSTEDKEISNMPVDLGEVDLGESSEDTVDVKYEVTSKYDFDESMNEWLDETGQIAGVYTRDVGDTTEILIVSKMVNSGGYEISIDDIYVNETGLYVHVDLVEPPADGGVTMALEHPAIIIQLEGVHENVQVIADDDFFVEDLAI